MINGSEVHDQIRRSLHSEEDAERRLSGRLYDCEDRITRLTQEREQIYGRIALAWLPELNAASVLRTLKGVQAEIEEIYVTRQRRRKAVELELQTLAATRGALDDQLRDLERRRADHAAVEAGLDAKVGAELQGREDYVRLRAALQRTQEEVAVLERHLDGLRKMALRRRAAYEAHPIFKYLLGRKPERPGALDRWVGSQVDFVRQKAAYDLLLQGPKSMERLTEEQRTERDRFNGETTAVVQEVAGRLGLLDAQKQTRVLNSERVTLLERITRSADETAMREDERADLDNTRGTHHAEALERLKAFLKGSEIQSLKAAVGPQGRIELDRIASIDEEIRALKRDAKQLQAKQADHVRRARELRSVESHILSSGYDDWGRRFNSGLDLPTLLAGLIAGSESARTISDALDHYRYVEPMVSHSHHSSFSSSDHSSSSFGSSSSGGSSSSSDGGSSSGGGFSTGGGF